MKKSLNCSSLGLLGVLFIFGFVMGGCQFEGSSDSSGSSSGSGGSGGSSGTSGTTVSNTEVKAEASGADFSSNQLIFINLTEQTVAVSDGQTSSEGQASQTSLSAQEISSLASSTLKASLSWQKITTTSLDFFSDTIKVKFTQDDSKQSTGVIRVDAEDTTANIAVILSGTKTDGGVKIQIPKEYEAGIYLDNVSITSSNYPCVEVTKGGAATVFLKGENILIDGRKYGYGYGSDYASTSKNPVTEGSDSKGTLYSKGGLSICQSEEGASLSVTQAYKNCIASKDGVLSVEGGILTLKNYISGGTGSSSGTSGSSSGETGKNGLFGGQGIVVNGGSIDFDGQGIISTSDIRKANGFKTDDEDYTSSFVRIAGGSTTVTTYNGKGINAPIIYISGGKNKFTVTGTTSYSERTSSGTWYDADGVKESGTVKFAPEGIEAETLIQISGGETVISAPDDGVNVSGTGGNLTISDGFLYVSSKGDGLDSNGNISVSGGVVAVSQTGGGNAPIDCGDGSYSFQVTGGTILALGSSDMFNESIPSSTSNAYISSTALGTSTKSLSVTDSSGAALVALEEPLSYAAAIFVSPKLTSGSSYNFVLGGTITGTEYAGGTGFFLPPESVETSGTGSGDSSTGSTTVSATATTQGGSGGMGGPGGSSFPGGSSGPGKPGW